MKKQYVLPALEMIETSLEDVLTASILEGGIADSYDWDNDLV